MESLPTGHTDLDMAASTARGRLRPSLRLLLIPGTSEATMESPTESLPTGHTDLDMAASTARGRLRPSLRLLLIPGTTEATMESPIESPPTDLDTDMAASTARKQRRQVPELIFLLTTLDLVFLVCKYIASYITLVNVVCVILSLDGVDQ